MSEQYNAELIEMLQKAVALKRNYWHDDASKMLRKLLGNNWQDEFYKRWLAEEDLRKEIGDE